MGDKDAFLSGEHTEEEKMSFLKRLDEAGVKNIEMEATALAAITKAAGVRSGNVCVTIVNRLEGDQVRDRMAKPIKLRTDSKTARNFLGDLLERRVDPVRPSSPATGGVIHQEGAGKGVQNVQR